MRPMLATPADPDAGLPADGDRWAYEVKWDGWRVLADVNDGAVRLWSRSEREITAAFPELEAIGRAHPDVLLDGEIVIMARGVPSFTALADRIHLTDRRRASALAARNPATLIAFDALRMYGVDLTERPWQERREALERLPASGEHWQLSPVYDDVDVLLEATREQGLEGVVAKRRTSAYRPGVRSSDWRKLAHRRVQSVLIGGWRPEINDRNQFGALLIGVWSAPGVLRFAGRMGSGLTGAGAQADLRRLLTPLQLDSSPFAETVPRADAKGATWVRPQVVVDVRHLGRTENGRLRQPVFRGVRSDLEPEDVRYE
ncbi:non-homologous end-joining DNA ligase [Kineosporia sp. J2-2]|uniref:DNA ligase (ATP) n=1 Tax=Kineosporia corallincola TaxID=2835133 RepID=A0ABS5TQJ2_9ACTN|nr:non-homologous end-joining DNA ligase [Kineosporia corallincola]MBT0772679.1 non-homologous end-joining DNA ligase [Kineosporia corallincola]